MKIQNKAKIQGFEVNTYSEEEAFVRIQESGGQVVTINPEIIAMAKEDAELKEIINSAELVIPDGIGVEIGLKILGHNVKRIPGINFARRLLTTSVKNAQTVALVGSKPTVLKKTIDNLRNEIQGINIIYSRDGYFGDNQNVIEDLKLCKPDIILVAMGAPKQEKFIYQLKKVLPNSIMVGVGGSFDVWSGFIKRAPEIYQKLGLEWLYRTILEPERFKRIFPTLPMFIINVLKEKWSGKC